MKGLFLMFANVELYELWQSEWHIPAKPLHGLSGLQTFIFTTSSAITYTKC